MRWKRCCGARPMATATADGRGRLTGRSQVVLRALFSRLGSGGRRARPVDPQRILIAHHLLLGDTLMLTPLVAKLRERHPAADLVMAVPEAYAPLYARAPYGLRAIGWDPRRPSLSPLWRERGFDLAFIPADNRMSWLALALSARWIVAFAGDRPPSKSWPVDEQWEYPNRPAAWGDMVAGLIAGPPPAAYRPAAWPAPPATAIAPALAAPYAVLHVGASTPLKQWEAARWATLAQRLSAKGIEPVWSAAASEAAIVHGCDPEARHRSFAGALSLPQIWQLIAGAALLVSPDTGIAHLGRIVGTPTVALFGPGAVTLTGAGAFWREAPYRAVTVDPFPCRDQRTLFKREIAWVRRCERSPAECPHPRCMDAIDVEAVAAALAALGIDLG
jgi:ADP-heptose:LPS heptosyltransferase